MCGEKVRGEPEWLSDAFRMEVADSTPALLTVPRFDATFKRSDAFYAKIFHNSANTRMWR